MRVIYSFPMTLQPASSTSILRTFDYLPTMKRLLFLFIPFPVMAQINLAPNPSFEDYTTCPAFYSTIDVYSDPYVTDWFRSSDGSSDYLNACDAGEVVGVPTSVFDEYCPARTGEAYVGFWSYLLAGNYREYVQAQLTEPMVEDGCYYVEFYVTPATSSDFSADNWTCDCIGMYISEERPLSSLFSYTPQINTVPGAFYTDTVGWTLVSGIYIAEGGEEWISIGNFNEDDETEVFDFLDEGAASYVYIFADDVLVTELSDLDVLNDTTLCAGETLVLSVPAGAGSYIWSTGDTTASISVTTTGDYWVELTTPCGTFTDSASIIFSIDDVLTGANDLDICYQELPYTLDPGVTYETQVWSTGDTTITIELDEEGVYILSGYSSCQSYVDTFYVNVIEQVPDPMVLQDTLVCAPEWTLVLEVPGFDEYAWSTGESSSSVSVSEAGTYYVTYSKNCDTYTDTIHVTIDPWLLVYPDLGPDTIICELLAENLVLDAGADLPDYLWNTGATTPTITVTQDGEYWVQSATECLVRSDTILVSPCVFLDVPNAFTPNGDGVNDFFTTVCSNCDAFLSLAIFNRWGQMVFETNDHSVGWDGKFQGEEQPMGTYVYVLRYMDGGKEAVTQGSLTLIR